MATASWNLAIAARTSASVGAPLAGALVSLAAMFGAGSWSGGAASPAWASWVAVRLAPWPATGSTTCGCERSPVAPWPAAVVVWPAELDPQPANTSVVIAVAARDLIR